MLSEVSKFNFSANSISFLNLGSNFQEVIPITITKTGINATKIKERFIFIKSDKVIPKIILMGPIINILSIFVTANLTLAISVVNLVIKLL